MTNHLSLQSHRNYTLVRDIVSKQTITMLNGRFYDGRSPGSLGARYIPIKTRHLGAIQLRGVTLL